MTFADLKDVLYVVEIGVFEDENKEYEINISRLYIKDSEDKKRFVTTIIKAEKYNS